MARKRKFEETKQDSIEQEEQDDQTEPKEGIIYRCDICGARFVKGCGLASHMRTHYELGLACPACKLVFRAKLSLNRHMRVAHGSEHPAGTLPPIDKDTVAQAPVQQKEEIKKADDSLLPVPQKHQKLVPTAAGPSNQPSSSSAKEPVEEKLVAPPVGTQKLPYTCPICQYGFETKMRAAYHFQSHRKKKWVMPKTARADYRKIGREKNIGFNIGSKLVEKWRLNCEYRPIAVRRTQLWHFMEENFGCPLDKTFKTDQENTRVQRVLRSQPGPSSLPAVKRPLPPPVVQNSKLPKNFGVPKMKKLIMKGKTVFGQMLCLGSSKFYLCRGCPYVTWNQSSLWRHTRHHIHRSKNAFTCSACNYSSIHLRNIQHHVKAHKRVIDVKHDYADWLRYEREINGPDFSGALGDEVDTITVPSKKRKVLPTPKVVTSPRRTRSRGAPLIRPTTPSTPKVAAPKGEEFPSPPSLVHKDQFIISESKTRSSGRSLSLAVATSPPVLQPMQAVPPKVVPSTPTTSVSTRPVRTTTSTARAAESAQQTSPPVAKLTRASARNTQTASQTPAATVSSKKTDELGIRTGPPPSKLARTTELSPSMPTISAEAKDIRWPSLISTLSSSADGPDYSPIPMKKLATTQKTTQNVQSTKVTPLLSTLLHAGTSAPKASSSTPVSKVAVKNVGMARLFQTTSSTKATPVAAKPTGTATPKAPAVVIATPTTSGKSKAVATTSVAAKPLTVRAALTTPLAVKPLPATSGSVKSVPAVVAKVTPTTTKPVKATPTTSGTTKGTPAVPKANKSAPTTFGKVKDASTVSETDKASSATSGVVKASSLSSQPGTATPKTPGTIKTAPASATAKVTTTLGTTKSVAVTVKTAPATSGTMNSAATTSAIGKVVPTIPATVKAAPTTPGTAKPTLTAPGSVKATSAATPTTKVTPVVQGPRPLTKEQFKTASAATTTPSGIAKVVTSAAVTPKVVKPAEPTSNNKEVSAVTSLKSSTSVPKVAKEVQIVPKAATTFNASVATASSIAPVTPKQVATPAQSTTESKKVGLPPKPVSLSTAVTPKEAPKLVPVSKPSGVVPLLNVSKVATTAIKPTSSGLPSQSAKVSVTPKPVVAAQPKVASVVAPKPVATSSAVVAAPTAVMSTSAKQVAPKDNNQVPSTSTSSNPTSASTETTSAIAEVVPAAKPRYRLMVQYNKVDPTQAPKLFKVLITSPEKDPPPPKKETRSTVEKSEPLAKMPKNGMNQVTTTTTVARVVSSSSSQIGGSTDQPLNKVYANMAARLQSSKQKIELTEFKAPGQAPNADKNRGSQEPTSSTAAAKSTHSVRKSARTIAMAEKIKEAERHRLDLIQREIDRRRDRAYVNRIKADRPSSDRPTSSSSIFSEGDALRIRRQAEEEQKAKDRKAAGNRVLAEYTAEQNARKERHEREWAEKHGSIPPPELKCNITAAELYHRIVAAKFGLTIPGADEPIPEIPPPPPVLLTATGRIAKVQPVVPEVTRKLRLHPLISRYNPEDVQHFESMVKKYKADEALKRANAEPGQEGVPTEKLVMKYAKHREYLKTEMKVERTGQCADCPFHDRKNLERLRRHRDKHFNNGVHKCTECNYSNFYRHDVQNHMFVDHYMNDVRLVEGISSSESEEDEPMPPPQPKKKAKRRRRANW